MLLRMNYWAIVAAAAATFAAIHAGDWLLKTVLIAVILAVWRR
jgi:hypothetical protein